MPRERASRLGRGGAGRGGARAAAVEGPLERAGGGGGGARCGQRVWRRGRAAELELLQLLPPPE